MRIISTKAHTVIGLIVGVLLVLAPFILDITGNTAATVVPIIVGIFIILNELITTSPASPFKLVPMRAHIVVDALTGLVLAASPWLFNYMDANNNATWLPHLIVGLLVVGYALMTNTADDREASALER